MSEYMNIVDSKTGEKVRKAKETLDRVISKHNEESSQIGGCWKWLLEEAEHNEGKISILPDNNQDNEPFNIYRNTV